MSITEVKPEGQPDNTVYKVDTSLASEGELESKVVEIFGEKMARHEMEFAAVTPSDDENGYTSATTLTFDERISRMGVEELLNSAADRLEISRPRYNVSNPVWDGTGDDGFKEWELLLTSDTSTTENILQDLDSNYSKAPLILSSSTIGTAVAGDMQSAATMAILVSLIGIVGYIWIRFQRVTYGLAAVLALVHDVAISLGAVALSYYLSGPLGFLMIDEFRISLPIVAAFLTIIGYSLNDTIVVFDRIREVKGKSPQLTAEMTNTSINQTLSRTLLTSLTTMIVVLILYTFGGQGIHGFAFALLIGVVVGTYSSIFIASPALVWMANRGVKTTANPKPKRDALVEAQ